MAWKMSGHYAENCNCDLLCPCDLSGLTKPATNPRCLVALVYHIDKGESEGLSLDGLNFVWVCDSPAIMSEGNWRVGTYIDAHGDDAQRTELAEIATGHRGGVPQAVWGFFGENMGTKVVPIDYAAGEKRTTVKVPELMTLDLVAHTAPNGEAPMVLTNTAHFMQSDLPLATAAQASLTDAEFGFEWDNTGRNAHFFPFAWTS